MSEATEVRGKATIMCHCLGYEGDRKVEGVFRYDDHDYIEGLVFYPDEHFTCPECGMDDEWGFEEPEPANVEELLTAEEE